MYSIGMGASIQCFRQTVQTVINQQGEEVGNPSGSSKYNIVYNLDSKGDISSKTCTNNSGSSKDYCSAVKGVFGID